MKKLASHKNFSKKDRSNKDADSFRKPDLFETNNVNENRIKEFGMHKDKWRELLSYWREYPDKFIDYIKPQNSKINLYFYQRVYLRIMFRYRKVFLTATRGTSKSYLQNLAFVLLCIMYGGSKYFIVAPGKEQAAKISQQCLDDIFEHYPLLRSEVKTYQENKDYTRLIFYNGSKYDVVQMTDAARGGRRHGGAIEEIADEKFNAEMLNAVVIPLMANSRIAKNGKVDPNEIHKREIYITTAGTQQSFAYEKFLEVKEEMMDGKSAFVMGNGYELPCIYGQLDIDFVENLKDSPTYNIMSFMREYESIWTGSSADSLVSEDKLKMSRRNPYAETEHCGDPNVEYLLTYDVSRNEGDANALSALLAIKLTRRPNGDFFKEVVNIFSMEGAHYLYQAKYLKEQVRKFKPFLLVIDANSYGTGVVDNLVLDLDDGNPPYSVVNDERYDKYKCPDSIPMVYALKSQNKDTKDSDMITHFMTVFNKGGISLLKSPYEGLKELKKKLKIKEMDTERDAELIIPYILTDILCEEIMNIRYRQQGNDVKEERVSKRIQRDKYSALKYGLWIVYQEEMKNKTRFDNSIDLSKLIAVSQGTNKSSQSHFGNSKGFQGFRR